MPSNQNPVFRQEIVPWYDGKKACYLVLIIMLFTFLFSLAGISVAGETSSYSAYIWIPLLTTLMSAGVIVSTTARLVKRYLNRFQKE